MDVLKQANDYGVQLYEEHQRFVKSFDARWRSDENVMLLLSAIALFTPERSNVLHKDVVKLEQVTDAHKFIVKGMNTKNSKCHPRCKYNLPFHIYRIPITSCSDDTWKLYVQMDANQEVHIST